MKNSAFCVWIEMNGSRLIFSRITCDAICFGRWEKRIASDAAKWGMKNGNLPDDRFPLGCLIE
ncbi:MAG: hypothetical protein CMJ19_06450 [Phycisphaeraceae bacterium]|nr:hypothetical protein [Phycisphaeraceae bacterium]